MRNVPADHYPFLFPTAILTVPHPPDHALVKLARGVRLR